MPLTPQITLTATLLDYSGAAIGSAALPAKIRIALCGYGEYLPRISGTAMVGKIVSWPFDIAYTGTPLSILLWGNDVILPSNTYYSIAVIDPSGNVIQANTYVFTGNRTYDLSTVAPSLPAPSGSGCGLVTVPF